MKIVLVYYRGQLLGHWHCWVMAATLMLFPSVMSNRSVIAFGKISIVEDEAEKMIAARLLSERYNPDDEEGFRKEIEKGFARMLAIRLDIEHLTGKEAIELVKENKGNVK